MNKGTHIRVTAGNSERKPASGEKELVHKQDKMRDKRSLGAGREKVPLKLNHCPGARGQLRYLPDESQSVEGSSGSTDGGCSGLQWHKACVQKSAVCPAGRRQWAVSGGR